MAALHGAVALKQVDHVALRVAKDLNLDVAGAQYVFLDQHRIIAKAVDGLALAAGKRCGKVFAFFHEAHALAATACAGLDEHGVANAVGFALQQLGVLVAAVVAGHQRHTGFFHELLGFGLQPHGADGAGGWPNKGQPCLRAGIGKVFVFAQKTIAGVNGLRASLLGGVKDTFPAQVTVFGGVAANVHGFIAGCDMLGLCVGIGVDRDGLDAEALGSRCHTAGDFAAVGNQDFFKHGLPPRQSRLCTLRVPCDVPQPPVASALRRYAAGRLYLR